MARDLASAFISEIEASSLQAAVLVKLNLDSGPVRVWSGYGNLYVNETPLVVLGEVTGEVLLEDEDSILLESTDSTAYTGVGDLGKIGDMVESQEIKANGLTIQLTGIPQASASLALNEEYQGRTIQVWFAVINSSGSLLADPYEVFTGKIDLMELMDNGETATLTLQIENELIDLQRPRERRYTPEDQKLDYPNDKGLDFVASIQDTEIAWGTT